MNIEIVEANLADPAHAESVLAVLDSYVLDPMRGATPLPTEVRQRVVPGLRAHPTSLVLLALQEKKAVGLAVCFVGFSTFRASPLLNVHDLAVLPECRGLGIGRRLLAAAEACARQRGCCKLTLEVRQDNHRARGLYQTFGFGRAPAGEERAPTLFLEKFLPRDPAA